MRSAALAPLIIAGSMSTALAAETFATDCSVADELSKATWATVDEKAFGGCRTGDLRTVVDDDRMCAIQIFPTRAGLFLDISETPATSAARVVPDDPQCVQTRDGHGCKIIGYRWLFQTDGIGKYSDGKSGFDELRGRGATNSSSLLPSAVRLVVANAKGVWITQQVSQKVRTIDAKKDTAASLPISATTSATSQVLSFGETYYLLRRKPYYASETSDKGTAVNEMVRGSYSLNCTVNGKSALLLSFDGETRKISSESIALTPTATLPPNVDQKRYDVLTFTVKSK